MKTAVSTFFAAYLKHATLNVGQALQGMRYFYSHPDMDGVAPRGTLKHLRLSLALRSKRVANDLFFASFPPHWHHSKDEIASLHTVSVKTWFQCGYCAWRFSESGGYKELTGDEDRRWDPRCK